MSVRLIERFRHSISCINNKVAKVMAKTRMSVNLLLFAFIIGLSAMTFSVSHSEEPTLLSGTVTKVRDGDTIEVGKIPIRLQGLSAPELKEPLGLEAKAFMRDLVFGKRVRCELNGDKTHDRFVGICFLEQKDIAEEIIAQGLARDCPRYSSGRYAQYEIERGREIKLPKYCF